MSAPPDSPAPRIERFDAAHLDAIIECVTTMWISDNVIARALGVTAEDYRPVATRICTQALGDDLGVMLREPDTDRVVGFTTAIDMVDALDAEQTKSEADNPRMRRWGALLSRGLRWYTDTYHHELPLSRGEVIYLNIGGTTPEHRGHGWINRMVVVTCAMLCLPRGYGRVVGIATHPHTVNKTRTMQVGSHVHEIAFADSGDPDLARITDPPCALLSVTPLVPSAAERFPSASPRPPAASPTPPRSRGL